MTGSTSVSVSVRGDISYLIEKRLEALDKGFRQNIGLVGLPGAGKTHFLARVFQSISVNPRFIPVYVNAAAVDFDHLVDLWAGAALSGLFLSQGVSAPSNFQSLMLAAEPIIPKTTEKIRFIKKHLHRDKPSSLCKELFAISDFLSQETGKKIILMIDEFDQLERLEAADPFGLLGKEIMVQKNTLYMVASSSPRKAKEIFKEKLSMLFGNFEVLDIASLDFEECVHFIDAGFPDLSLSPFQKEFMIRLTDGKPDYLELLLDQLQVCFNHHAVREIPVIQDFSNAVYSGHLVDAFSRELTPPFGRLCYFFESKMERYRQMKKEAGAHLKTIFALARGRCRLNAIAADAGRNMAETKKVLNRLEEDGLVVRRGTFYILEDPLLRFWVREYFERNCLRLHPGAEQLNEEFRAALKRELENVETFSEAPVMLRIEKLLREFRSDVAEIEGKKIQCPQFSEVISRPLNQGGYVFTAKGPKGKWYCQLHEQKVTEEDVVSFQSEIKKHKRRPHGRILMMLRGLDQNAKLMAQQAQIQLWDLRILNQLLDLFGLPKMILLPDKEIYGPPMGSVAQSVYSA